LRVGERREGVKREGGRGKGEEEGGGKKKEERRKKKEERREKREREERREKEKRPSPRCARPSQREGFGVGGLDSLGRLGLGEIVSIAPRRLGSLNIKYVLLRAINNRRSQQRIGAL
jgi:hypothetical protein